VERKRDEKEITKRERKFEGKKFLNLLEGMVVIFILCVFPIKGKGE